MEKFRVLTILVAFALLVIVVFVALGFVSFSLGLPKGEVSKKIKNLYELANPGTTVEVLTVTEESGLYKAVLKASGVGGTNYAEVYVSKDGKLLTQNVILVEQSIEQIKRLKDFVDCLDGKGLKIYGISNQTATLLQLNVLGVYSTKLYMPCDGELAKNCIAANVTQVPSVVFGGRIEPGVKAVQWFEQATGCKF
jgi:hypothetical protein